MKNARSSDKRCGSKPGLPFYLGGRFGATSCKLPSPKEKDSFPPSQEKATANPTISIKEILRVYFDAMIAGYLAESDDDSRLVRNTNSGGGMKDITFTDGDFVVYDTWCDYFGFTLIRWRGLLVWQMSYCGEYEPEAIPVLKEVLRASFEARRWCGGRGAPYMEIGDHTYRNTVEQNNPLEFWGYERINITSGPKCPRLLGRHRYLGQANLKFVTP